VPGHRYRESQLEGATLYPVGPPFIAFSFFVCSDAVPITFGAVHDESISAIAIVGNYVYCFSPNRPIRSS